MISKYNNLILRPKSDTYIRLFSAKKHDLSVLIHGTEDQSNILFPGRKIRIAGRIEDSANQLLSRAFGRKHCEEILSLLNVYLLALIAVITVIGQDILEEIEYRILLTYLGDHLAYVSVADDNILNTVTAHDIVMLRIIYFCDDIYAAGIKIRIRLDLIVDDILNVYEICKHSGIGLLSRHKIIREDQDTDILLIHPEEFIDRIADKILFEKFGSHSLDDKRIILVVIHFPKALLVIDDNYAEKALIRILISPLRYK